MLRNIQLLRRSDPFELQKDLEDLRAHTPVRVTALISRGAEPAPLLTPHEYQPVTQVAFRGVSLVIATALHADFP